MNSVRSAKYALGGAAAVATLAACTSNGGGGASQLAPMGPGMPSNAMHSALGPTAAIRPTTAIDRRDNVTVNPDRRRSWMDASAKGSSLLYISDSGTNAVRVYSYPKVKLTGTLTGFSNPQGECVDKAGNVWVTSTSASQIVEYAHGATTPIATLNDPGQYPVGCSVDAKTGNLAVSNIYATTGPPGSVSIYKKAAGSPTSYAPPGFADVYFLGYDSKGTLYLDGITSGSSFLFASFKGKKFTTITLGHAIGGPGAVQAVGKNVVVGDQTIAANAAYTFAISGSTGTLESTTPLTGANDIVQFYVQKKTIAGGDFNPNGGSTVDLFAYPAGGSPTKTVTGVTAPIGAVVSP